MLLHPKPSTSWSCGLEAAQQDLELQRDTVTKAAPEQERWREKHSAILSSYLPTSSQSLPSAIPCGCPEELLGHSVHRVSLSDTQEGSEERTVEMGSGDSKPKKAKTEG